MSTMMPVIVFFDSIVAVNNGLGVSHPRQSYSIFIEKLEEDEGG